MKRSVWMLFAALAVACAGDADTPATEAADVEAAADTEAAEELQVVDGAIPPPSNPDLPQGSVGAVEDGQVVTVRLTAQGVSLSQDTLPQGGQVTFILENESAGAHQLHVRKTTGGQWKSMAVPPGGNVEMSMILSGGLYDVMTPPAAGGEAPAALQKRLVIR